MATTALHPNALPGKLLSFSAKTAATPEHAGDFTRLSVIAVPGGIRVFLPKSPSIPPSHTGDFTRLSVIAVPGGIHEFAAKAKQPVEPPIYAQPGGGHSTYAPRYDRALDLILREDEEIIEIISILASRRLI